MDLCMFHNVSYYLFCSPHPTKRLSMNNSICLSQLSNICIYYLLSSSWLLCVSISASSFHLSFALKTNAVPFHLLVQRNSKMYFWKILPCTPCSRRRPKLCLKFLERTVFLDDIWLTLEQHWRQLFTNMFWVYNNYMDGEIIPRFVWANGRFPSSLLNEVIVV